MSALRELGFTQRYVKMHIAQAREVDTRLREIGRSLGWGRDGTTLPSLALLARKPGREKEYKFRYQGTSRFVHFSGQEIFCRAWGKKGDVIIGSDRFAPYWNQFSLYWLFRIFIDTHVSQTGKLCNGVQTHTEGPDYDHQAFKPWRIQALAFKAIRRLYPDYPLWRDFAYEYEQGKLAIDVINGGPLLRDWVDDALATPQDLS